MLPRRKVSLTPQIFGPILNEMTRTLEPCQEQLGMCPQVTQCSVLGDEAEPHFESNMFICVYDREQAVCSLYTTCIVLQVTI